MTNFYKLVPDIAIEFPFELDKFQKEVRYSLASVPLSEYLKFSILMGASSVLCHPRPYTSFC